MRLIDADALEETFRKTYKVDGKGVICAVIDEAQTVEAEPVKHGRWIPCAKSGLVLTELMRKEGVKWYGFKCSACNSIRKGNALTEANYCEHCGAKMDGEEE